MSGELLSTENRLEASRRRTALFAGLACLLASYAVADGVAYWWISEMVDGRRDYFGASIAAAIIGFIFSQIGAAVIGLVFGRRAYIFRLAGIWVAGLGLIAVWMVGTISSDPDLLNRNVFWEELRAVVAGLPLVVLLLQPPLWLLKLYFGWRIEPESSGPWESKHAALSIRDILIGTTITALSLAAVQFVPDSREDLNVEFWLAWGIAAVYFGVATLFLIVPLLYLTLGLKDARLAAVATTSYCFLAPTIFVVVIAVIYPGIRRDSDFYMMPIALVTCALAISAPLWIIRAAGYRLRIGKQNSD